MSLVLGGVTQLPFAHLTEESDRMQAEPIIWLTQFLSVGALTEVDENLYAQLWSECCAMQFSAVKNKTHHSRCHHFQYTL